MAASVPSAGIMPEYVAQIKADFGADVVVNAGTGMARTGSGVEDGARAFIKEITTYFGV
jgi:ribulose 1,5-bisphosphate carboxylase large subunit-like protein